MKKVLFFISAILVLTVTSCNVQERIVFNEEMGGVYETSFDLSNMLQIAGATGTSTSDKSSKKMDTIIKFNDVLVMYKDSIASLSQEKQQQLKNMKDMNLHMQMDQENSIFKFKIDKAFKSFKEIELVSYELDEMMNLAKENATTTTPQGPGADMLKTDKVRYIFENNIFKRVDEKLFIEHEVEQEPVAEADMMMQGLMSEFEDLLTESKMTLEYVFPKRVKSVSHEEAIISPDGKTVTFVVDWKSLMDNEKLLESFEVELKK